MKCKRCNRRDATMHRLGLYEALDDEHDDDFCGLETYGAMAALCPTCAEYVGDEIGRLMVCKNPAAVVMRATARGLGGEAR